MADNLAHAQYSVMRVIELGIILLTLNPSSPGFSGSKSYNAVQCGPVARGCCCCCGAIGVLAGDRIGDGNGEAVNFMQNKKYMNSRSAIIFNLCDDASKAFVNAASQCK